MTEHQNHKKHTSYRTRTWLKLTALLLLVLGLAGAFILLKNSSASAATSSVGDLNNDGVVNVLDLSILLADLNTTRAVADINGDGTVNTADLTILLNNFNTTVSGGGSGTTGRTYPLHTNIVSTTFWVGEIFNGSIGDGSQVCSTYDSQWAFHWSGINNGTTDPSTDCEGAPMGGCDGVTSGTGANFQCNTEKRTAANNYFPTSVPTPKENPFYIDLPFDDINDKTAYAERCTVIPWANDPGYAGHCTDTNFSYMKNFWVKITDTITGGTCYGQNEDAGPSSGSLYHDANYVFGTTDARPVNTKYSGDKTQGDGMDVSPALNGCLGFKDLDGDDDHVNWQFVDAADVPAGPWKQVVTTSGITE